MEADEKDADDTGIMRELDRTIENQTYVEACWKLSRALIIKGDGTRTSTSAESSTLRESVSLVMNSQEPLDAALELAKRAYRATTSSTEAREDSLLVLSRCFLAR